MKRTHIATLVIVGLAVVGIAPIAVYLMANPWSEVLCSRQEINIKTGQARYSRYLYFHRIWEQVKDTPLSVALGGKTVDTSAIKPWHTVNTFSLRKSYSPYYRFHGALAQAQEFELLSDLHGLKPEETRDLATKILSAWQTTGHRSAADALLQDIPIPDLQD
jgi:hypothetical protein